MEIIKIDPENPDRKIVSHAVEILKHGGILVYPTDTSYGIGVDVTNPIAIKRLFRLKKRDLNKPVAVIVPSIEYLINTFIDLTIEQEKIIREFVPGAVTFLVKPISQDRFMYQKLGFRIPAYLFTQRLANKFNGMYATTSANIADNKSCYSVPEFLEQFKNQGADSRPDLVLDAGSLPPNPQSTIVDLTTNPPKIDRQGAVEFKI